MTQYDYDNLTAAPVAPDLFATKPKPTPRKPLPDMLIQKILGSARDGEPRAVHVPAEAGEKAAKNLLNRIRDYAAKECGLGVRTKVTEAETGGWDVAFKLQPKRSRSTSVEEAAQAAEELSQSLDATVDEVLHTEEPPATEEADPLDPPAKPKRTSRRK